MGSGYTWDEDAQQCVGQYSCVKCKRWQFVLYELYTSDDSQTCVSVPVMWPETVTGQDHSS